MGSVITWMREYWGAVLFMLIFAVLLLGYISGFRIGIDGIEKSGAIRVEGVPKGTYVYLDEIRRHQVAGAATSMFASSGAHTVVVEAEGYQPWHELVSITSGEELNIDPLLIPTTLVQREVAQSEYATAVDTLKSTVLPTIEQPLLLAHGCVRVYVQVNRILADRVAGADCIPPEYICTDASIAEFGSCVPTVIFDPVEDIRSVMSYPNRFDTLIVSSGSLAYVLELDPREPRFFAPIARDTDIRVAPWTDTSILITNKNEPRELPL